MLNNEINNTEFKHLNIFPIARIAIVGFPNVGKSSLFNRLNKENIAVTSPISGTTRDINERNIRLNNADITLIDTGGVGFNFHLEKKDTLQDAISNHTLGILESVDIVLYMVDGSVPFLEDDFKLFNKIRSVKKEIILVLNKIDSDKIELNSSDFMRFGKDFLCISIIHNRGITKLLECIEKLVLKMHRENRLKKNNKIELNSDDEIRIGIIGRVNVGKSSLLNAILQKNRSLVSNVPGTTIDPVDEFLIYKNKKIVFVDTAGIRAKSKILGIEKYALERTKKVLSNCHIALLVLDSSTSLVSLDEKISSMVFKNNLGVIVILNKWDIKSSDFENKMKEYKHKFRFLEYAPVISVSSINFKRVSKIKDIVLEVFDNFSRRIPTSKLNQIIQNAVKNHVIPSDHGKLLKIYYATQFAIRPPKVALIMNKPTLHFSYKRYLVNSLRKEENFLGSPIIIEAKDKNSEEAKQKD